MRHTGDGYDVSRMKNLMTSKKRQLMYWRRFPQEQIKPWIQGLQTHQTLEINFFTLGSVPKSQDDLTKKRFDLQTQHICVTLSQFGQVWLCCTASVFLSPLRTEEETHGEKTWFDPWGPHPVSCLDALIRGIGWKQRWTQRGIRDFFLPVN